MAKFSVTYEIVTPESAEIGDADERGFIDENVSFREAIELVQLTRTCDIGGIVCIEADSSNIESARWFTVYNGAEYETGAHESRSLHIPDHVTSASRRRIARVLGVI